MKNRMMMAWWAGAMLVATAAVWAATAAADVIPSDMHFCTTEYELVGVAECDGYQIVYVAELWNSRTGAIISTEVTKLADGDVFRGRNGRMTTRARMWLFAVKGELPAEITRETLTAAGAIWRECSDIFNGGYYVPDSEPEHKIRTVYHVRIDTSGEKPVLKLRQTRQIAYGRNGQVVNDLRIEGNDDEPQRQSDRDGQPDGTESDFGATIPSESATPVSALLAVAGLAFVGLLLGLFWSRQRSA